MAGDDDEMFMTRSLNVTPKTIKQHLIIRSDKSVAYVTNNKRLCSTFCTIDRHEASRGLFSTAELRSYLHCQSLLLSYLLHGRQLLFYRRLLSNNTVFRTLADLPRVCFEMLDIAAKYDLGELRYSTETVKNTVWLSFVNNIRF